MTLTVEEGQRINITVLHFNIRFQSTCKWDWLEIEDEKYCGEIGTSSEISTPFTIITNTNSVNVTFGSDNFNNGLPGFLAVW